MGRPRTPTAILEFKGAYKKNPQRKRTGEPQPENPIGKPPDFLSAQEKRAWRYLVKKAAAGVLTEMDEPGMVVMSKSFARLYDEPDMTETDRVKISTMLGKFGFNPSERAKLSVPQGKKKDQEGNGYW